MNDILQALSFISDHIHVAGWISLIVLAVKGSWRISKFFDKVKDAGETIDLLATNHLPHIQSGIEDLNKEVKGLRQDINQTLLAIALHKNDNIR